MPAKNRLQRFIELHEEGRQATVGEAQQIHESFVEMGLILASELDKKRDKKKTELERVLDGQSLTQKQILYVKSPFCGICGREFKNIKEATVDHIKPKKLGGKNELRNLQLACPECNVRKGHQYNETDPNDIVYPATKKNVRFMLEESNLIEGVEGKDAVDEAFMAYKWIIGHDELTADSIKKCHDMLMRNRDLEEKYKGVFRPIPVMIGGHIKAQPAIVIDSLIRDWCEEIKTHTTFEEIKQDHIRFEDIHPFVDGNGRMGRILMNWQLVRAKLPLCVILNKNKHEYYKWFQAGNDNPLKFDGEGVRR